MGAEGKRSVNGAARSDFLTGTAYSSVVLFLGLLWLATSAKSSISVTEYGTFIGFVDFLLVGRTSWMVVSVCQRIFIAISVCHSECDRVERLR